MTSRQPVLFLLALIALCGSLTAVFATTAQRDFDLRGYVDPTQTSDLPFRIPRLGVNVELTQYSASTLPEQFTLMQQAHIHWLRQFVRWDALQPQPGVYDWSAWDTITRTLEDFPDLKLVVVLVNTPAWARSDPSLPTSAPPADPNTFASFATAFAARYGNAIDFYQIWDEPNLTAAWGGLNPRPVEYLALLRAAYPAIHAADAVATVITAALAPTTETGPHNISDWRYLDDLYRLDAASSFDAVAGKPYGFNSSPQDRIVDQDTLNFSRLIGLREVMINHGDGHKALWASNFGWNSLPLDWKGQPSIWGSVDSENQTRYTLDALTRADREWAWLGGMILYHWQPDAPVNDPVWGFALRTPAGDSTSLYDALNHHADTIASNGLYPAANPYTSYSGVWTFSALGADIGWLRDSRFTFDFTGRDVALLLRKDDYVGYLYPLIDNQPSLTNAVPRDAAGNPYIILTSGSLQPETALIPVARQLPDAPHSLSAVADRGYDRYALAGFAVSSGDLAAPYNTQIAIGALTVLIAGFSVVITGIQLQWLKLLHALVVLWQPLSHTMQFILSLLASLLLMIGMLLTWGDASPALFRREPVQIGLSILTAGLIYLNPALPVTLLAVLALLLILYHRTEFGLALIIFFAPFFLFPVELYRFAFPMTELLLMLTFTGWLLRIMVRWAQYYRGTSEVLTAPVRQWHLLDFAVLAWVILGFISLGWTMNRVPAVTELRTLVIEPALFYLIFRTLPLTQRDVLRIIDSLLAAGLIVCIVGLVLYLRGEAIITAEDTARRLASVYGSPNNVALFLGRCIPFALAFTLLALDRTRRWIAALILGVMMFTVILTQSVGAIFIGIPLSIATVLLLVYRRQALLPLLALIILAVIGFTLSATLSERFARALDFSEGTNFYRIRIWQSALNILQTHPITGLGLDQFLYAFRGQYILPDAWQEPNLSHPHNFLLDIWIRLGIAGIGIFFVIQFLFWRGNLRQIHQLSNSDSKVAYILLIGIMGSMVNLLTHGLIDNSIFVIDLALVFMLLLSITVYLNSSSDII